MDFNKFDDLTAHDLWLYSNEILDINAADGIVNVICDLEINKTYTIVKRSPFATTKIIFSLCPLIHSPLDIKININKEKIVDSIHKEYEKFEASF